MYPAAHTIVQTTRIHRSRAIDARKRPKIDPIHANIGKQAVINPCCKALGWPYAMLNSGLFETTATNAVSMPSIAPYCNILIQVIADLKDMVILLRLFPWCDGCNCLFCHCGSLKCRSHNWRINVHEPSAATTGHNPLNQTTQIFYQSYILYNSICIPYFSPASLFLTASFSKSMPAFTLSAP